MKEALKKSLCLACLAFNGCPHCQSTTQTGHDNDQRTYLRTRYGSNIPDSSSDTMLLNVMIDDVHKDIRDRRHTLLIPQAVLDYINCELAR